MGKFNNLTNQKFGELVVIERDFSRKNKHTYWKCKCSCGKEISTRADYLLSGKAKSCGEKIHHFHLPENEKYGLLTVVEIDYKKSLLEGRAYCKCICECGNSCTVRKSQLLDSSAKSCGCLRSTGEMIIAKILLKEAISFKKEISFNDLKGTKGGLLFFDFGIYQDNKLRYLIEYNGKQHYEPLEYFGGEERFLNQQENDRRKIEYCLQHKIPLIIISYKDNITKELIVRRDLFC